MWTRCTLSPAGDRCPRNAGSGSEAAAIGFPERPPEPSWARPCRERYIFGPGSDGVADDDAALFCPLEFRYGRKKVRALFSRSARLGRALQVEAALSAAEAELGMIPAEAG